MINPTQTKQPRIVPPLNKTRSGTEANQDKLSFQLEFEANFQWTFAAWSCPYNRCQGIYGCTSILTLNYNYHSFPPISTLSMFSKIPKTGRFPLVLFDAMHHAATLWELVLSWIVWKQKVGKSRCIFYTNHLDNEKIFFPPRKILSHQKPKLWLGSPFMKDHNGNLDHHDCSIWRIRRQDDMFWLFSSSRNCQILCNTVRKVGFPHSIFIEVGVAIAKLSRFYPPLNLNKQVLLTLVSHFIMWMFPSSNKVHFTFKSISKQRNVKRITQLYNWIKKISMLTFTYQKHQIQIIAWFGINLLSPFRTTGNGMNNNIQLRNAFYCRYSSPKSRAKFIARVGVNIINNHYYETRPKM